MDKLLPEGVYRVVFDGMVLGRFNTLMEAQQFQSNLGKRGSQVVSPNLRSQMSEDEIKIAEYEAKNLGKSLSERMMSKFE